jgi:hypothetical protein
MKRLAAALILCALTCVPALAQQPPSDSADGPPREMLQKIEAVRDAARTRAAAALSDDHRAQVAAVVNRVKAGQLGDARTAAQQIDAILTPQESQAVLAARDAMMNDIRAAAAGGGPGMGGPPGPGGGGPGAGGEPAGEAGPVSGPSSSSGPPPQSAERGRGFRSMRNDAGFALLTLDLDREQMRALFTQGRPQH